MVKEIARLKGDLASLVPPVVIKKVNQKYSDMRV